MQNEFINDENVPVDEKLVDAYADMLSGVEEAGEAFGGLTVDDVNSLLCTVFHTLVETPIQAQTSDFGAISDVHNALVCIAIQVAFECLGGSMSEFDEVAGADDPPSSTRR